MTTLEAQAILADAPNIVARAILGGYARFRSSEEISTEEKRSKGIRIFTAEHRAKLRAAQQAFRLRQKS